MDRFGTISNTEAAKHAVVLFKNYATLYEHRSLALSVLSLSIPQQAGENQANLEKKTIPVTTRPSTSSYIFHAFFVDASGSELLSKWLIAAIVDENFGLGKYIAEVLKGAIEGFKGLSIKTNSTSEQAQLTKVKTLVQEAVQKENLYSRKLAAEREKLMTSESSSQDEAHSAFLKSLQLLTRTVDASVKALPTSVLSSDVVYASTTPVSSSVTLNAKKRLLEKKDETTIKKKAKGVSTLASIISSNGEEKTRLSEEKERKKQRLLQEREREREERMGKKADKIREKQIGKQRKTAAPRDTSNLNLVPLNRKSSDNAAVATPTAVFVPFGKAGSNGDYFKSSSTKRIKWRDQDDTNPGGALYEIREYDFILEELQAMGTFKPRKHGYLLEQYEGNIQKESIEFDGIGEEEQGEQLSYNDRRRLEHRLEKEELSRSQQEARDALRSLASNMSLQTPWMTPEALALNANQMIDAESREKKQQTARLSKKAATIYTRTQDIPADPATAQSSLGTNLGAPTSVMEFSWYDEEELAAMQESTAAATASAAASSCGMMGGMPEELLSLLPEYVFNMEEEQLAMLVQFLGDEKYACLLEDPTSQEFQDLVNQIAPGIAEINPDEDEAIGNNAYSTSNMYYAQDDPNQYYQQQSLYSPPLQSTQQSYYGQDYHQQHRQQFNQYYDQQYYATGSQQPPVSSYGYDPHTHQQQNSYNQQAYPPQHAHPPQGRGQYPYQHHHSHQQQQGYGTQGYGSYHGGGYGY